MDDNGLSETLQRLTLSQDEDFRVVGKELSARTENAKLPGRLYHYTNDAGLNGILSSGKIWFNDVYSLNDSTEDGHGIDLALNILKNENRSTAPFARIIAKYIRKLHVDGAYQNRSSIFIASFTSKKDDLSQWRAYADNGRGYSDGFSANQLREGLNAWLDDSTYQSLFPVIYSEKSVCMYMNRIIDSTEKCIIEGVRASGNLSPTIIKFIQHLTTNPATYIYMLSAFSKNNAYRDENEYRCMRMVIKTRSEIKAETRLGSYKLVRYQQFPWREHCEKSLKQIIAGPRGEVASEKFANDVLRHNDIRGVKVVSSKVPYRA